MSIVDLKTLTYKETQPQNWSVDGLVFGQINLLVGKNATGKTRILHLIAGLARQTQADKLLVANSDYDAVFSVDGKELRYKWKAEYRKVLEEGVWFHGEKMLSRDDKTLTLRYEHEGKEITHEPSEDEMSASARKDKLQHPFLLPLTEWGQSVRHYLFGSQLGKDHWGIIFNQPQELDDRDQNRVIGIFRKAKKEFGDAYIQSLLADMNELGYPLTEVDATQPGHIEAGVPLAPDGRALGQLALIGVREEGVDEMYFQDTISQGMFRALSILIQVTYSQMAQRAHCILIDDIGEGLDFDRSSRLIEMLRRKAQQSKIQLIMSTNDQFVMNKVPLDEWSLLQRRGNHISVRNIHNSRKVFEDFRFVGMSNFSFFEVDFANEEPGDRQLILEGAADNA
ncbi:MAG TPA: AAA family ATPase [Pirellulales bacterium]|nr:AAA family ATPase [Pirellulales bacterium]